MMLLLAFVVALVGELPLKMLTATVTSKWLRILLQSIFDAL